MWVQFETRGETGTYFTLYSVDHPDKAINKRVLMQAVNLGVFVNLFGPEVPSVFLQVSVAQPLHFNIANKSRVNVPFHHAIHYELVHKQETRVFSSILRVFAYLYIQLTT